MGLPYMTGRSQKAIFSYVRKKSLEEIEWLERALFIPSRLGCPNKSSNTSVANVCYAIVQAPQDSISEVEVMIRKFYWSSGDNEKKIH